MTTEIRSSDEQEELEEAIVLGQLELWFRNKGRRDWSDAAYRVLNACLTSSARACLCRTPDELSKATIPVLAKLVTNSAELEETARRLAVAITSLKRRPDKAERLVRDLPRRPGPQPDILVMAIVEEIAETYTKLTGKRCGRGYYAAKGKAYGFQRFLAEMFEAIGIEASAAHHARLLASRHQKN